MGLGLLGPATDRPRSWRQAQGDIHCLLSAFCILSFSFSCGVSLGWGRGEEAGGVGVPELPTHLRQEPGTCGGRGRL